MVESRPRPAHRRTPWRAVALLLSLSMIVVGCTTMQPLAVSSDALREALRAGEVGQPGQQVIAVTADGERHAFTFQGVDTAQDVVRGQASTGEAVTVPIEDVVALRVPTADGTRSAILAALVLFVVALVVAGEAFEDFMDIFGS